MIENYMISEKTIVKNDYLADNLLEQINIAKEYLKEDDLSKNDIGFLNCQKAAEQKNIEALILLGTYYRYGIGCNKDFKKSINSIRQAKRLGSKEASKIAKEMRKNGFTEKKALYVFRLIIAILVLATIVGGFIAFFVLWPSKRFPFMIDHNPHRGVVVGEGYSSERTRYVTSYPREGFQFLGYYENENFLSANYKLKYVTKKDKHLRAIFVPVTSKEK